MTNVCGFISSVHSVNKFFHIICFSYQIFHSLTFILSWCKWKHALIHPYLTTFLPFLYKSGMLSIIYHKYESFIQTIPLKASYDMRITFQFFINWFLFFDSAMKHCVFSFEKRLSVCQKLGILSKRIKIFEGSNQQSLLLFYEILPTCSP